MQARSEHVPWVTQFSASGMPWKRSTTTRHILFAPCQLKINWATRLCVALSAVFEMAALACLCIGTVEAIETSTSHDHALENQIRHRWHVSCCGHKCAPLRRYSTPCRSFRIITVLAASSGSGMKIRLGSLRITAASKSCKS